MTSKDRFYQKISIKKQKKLGVSIEKFKVLLKILITDDPLR